MFFKIIVLKNLQISQESTSPVFFNKVAGAQNCNFRDSSTSFFLWNLQKFYRTFPVAVSESFRFAACISIKKETPAKIFFCEFCKILRTSLLLTEHLWMTAFCVYLWILRSFSEHFFFVNHLWETAYFMYKLQNFNH